MTDNEFIDKMQHEYQGKMLSEVLQHTIDTVRKSCAEVFMKEIQFSSDGTGIYFNGSVIDVKKAILTAPIREQGK